MAGTNEVAFFRCRSICTGGGPESGRKNSKKCLPAGTGTKIYFSSHSSDQHPKDVYSENSIYCPEFVSRNFVLPRANSRGVEFLCFYSL